MLYQMNGGPYQSNVGYLRVNQTTAQAPAPSVPVPRPIAGPVPAVWREPYVAQPYNPRTYIGVRVPGSTVGQLGLSSSPTIAPVSGSGPAGIPPSIASIQSGSYEPASVTMSMPSNTNWLLWTALAVVAFIALRK